MYELVTYGNQIDEIMYNVMVTPIYSIYLFRIYRGDTPTVNFGHLT